MCENLISVKPAYACIRTAFISRDREQTGRKGNAWVTAEKLVGGGASQAGRDGWTRVGQWEGRGQYTAETVSRNTDRISSMLCPAGREGKRVKMWPGYRYTEVPFSETVNPKKGRLGTWLGGRKWDVGVVSLKEGRKKGSQRSNLEHIHISAA